MPKGIPIILLSIFLIPNCTVSASYILKVDICLVLFTPLTKGIEAFSNCFNTADLPNLYNISFISLHISEYTIFTTLLGNRLNTSFTPSFPASSLSYQSIISSNCSNQVQLVVIHSVDLQPVGTLTAFLYPASIKESASNSPSHITSGLVISALSIRYKVFIFVSDSNHIFNSFLSLLIFLAGLYLLVICSPISFLYINTILPLLSSFTFAYFIVFSLIHLLLIYSFALDILFSWIVGGFIAFLSVLMINLSVDILKSSTIDFIASTYDLL